MSEKLKPETSFQSSTEEAEKDWRRATYIYDDLLSTLDAQGSYDDFSGRAVIYESVDAKKPLDIDLFIGGINITLEENIQVSDHVGDTFSVACFGKSPMRVSFSAILADTQLTCGKMQLIDAWKNKLRLAAVARTGNIPIVVFGNHVLQGPFISMKISERGDSSDAIVIAFSMLLTGMQVYDESKPLFFDYVHGVESDNPQQYTVKIQKSDEPKEP